MSSCTKGSAAFPLVSICAPIAGGRPIRVAAPNIRVRLGRDEGGGGAAQREGGPGDVRQSLEAGKVRCRRGGKFRCAPPA